MNIVLECDACEKPICKLDFEMNIAEVYDAHMQMFHTPGWFKYNHMNWFPSDMTKEDIKNAATARR